jgi:hypothetical protein
MVGTSHWECNTSGKGEKHVLIFIYLDNKTTTIVYYRNGLIDDFSIHGNHQNSRQTKETKD